MSDQPDTTGPDKSAPMSAVEAAQRAGVNEKTIRRAIASGKLRAPKVHGAYRISPADLRAWQDSLEADTPGPEADTTPDNLSPVVDELRRLLDLERTERQEAQKEVSKLTGEMGYWRGQAEAFQHQLAALTAGSNDHHVEDDDVLAGDFTETAPQASPNGPQREQADQGLITPEHPPSWLLAAWQRLRGRS